MTLKEMRQSFGITQVEAAKSIGIPLRTYARYEANPDEANLKYQKIMVEKMLKLYLYKIL